MKISKTTLLAATLILSSSLAYANTKKASTDKSGGLECEVVTHIENAYLANHLTVNVRDKKLEERVIEQYLKRLDPAKIYLLSTDVDKIKGVMKNVFDKTKKADCAFLTEVQAIVLKRVEERLEFAKKFLDAKYKVDEKAEFVYDPEKRAYAKDEKEIESYFKDYLHFQAANYILTDIKLKESRERVVKNYERLVKKTKDTTLKTLIDDYMDAFARSLDPHSSFFSSSYYEDFSINMSLSLEGIGATLSQQDGFTTVESLVPGGAADRSSLIKPQDRIVAVSDKDGKMINVIDMDLQDVVRKIRGPKGTKVKLTILRKEAGKNNRFEVSLTREKVNLEDQAAAIYYIDKANPNDPKVKNKIAVINLPSFYSDGKREGRSSARDVKKLIAEARKKKVDGIVLDLADNSGGSLDDSVKLAGLFFKTGNVVKQSQRIEGREIVLADTDPTVDWSGPLVILTSRMSASASEIVSGTLKDYKRAVVVGGDHTYGKGSVQTVVEIPQKLGALKITIGMFFTPGGFSTQHRGVEADIPLPSPYNKDDIGEKSLDYSLAPKKIEPFLSKEAYSEEGPDAWKMIKPEWIKTLSDNSKARVEKSAEFKKIVEDLEKTKTRGKVVKVSEILNDPERKENEKKMKKMRTANKAEKSKEYLKNPELQEAANILNDLIELEKQDVKVVKK